MVFFVGFVSVFNVCSVGVLMDILRVFQLVWSGLGLFLGVVDDFLWFSMLFWCLSSSPSSSSMLCLLCIEPQRIPSHLHIENTKADLSFAIEESRSAKSLFYASLFTHPLYAISHSQTYKTSQKLHHQSKK